jgi:two-component system aerobic respiration control sensor histidine kinase ArcB
MRIPLQILLIEDHGFTAEVTKIILSEIDCSVTIAYNAQAAIDLVQQRYFDLIFMDVGLPDLDGYETTQWIRQNPHSLNQAVPIVALTALADNQDKERCLKAGMNAVLIKPIYKSRALEILNALLPRFIHDSPVSLAASKIIDLELGANMFNGNTDLAKQMLIAFIESLEVELEKLDLAYKSKSWEIFASLIRKLQGGISYCGTPRLQTACSRLEIHLRTGYHELSPLLYKQFLKEIAAVKEEHIALK